VFGGTVNWSTKKQTCVALSTTEAEYVALATAAAETMWIRQLLTEMNVMINSAVQLLEDNQSCIKALENWDQKRMKHIDIKYHFIKDLAESGIISVSYVASKDQKADVMTKPLDPELFYRHLKNLGMTGVVFNK
jgi:hypothetical protein